MCAGRRSHRGENRASSIALVFRPDEAGKQMTGAVQFIRRATNTGSINPK